MSVSRVCEKSNTSRAWPSSCTARPVGDPQVAGSPEGLSVGSLHPREGDRWEREPRGGVVLWLLVPVALLCLRGEAGHTQPGQSAALPWTLGGQCLGLGRGQRVGHICFPVGDRGPCQEVQPPPKQVRAQTPVPWLLVPSASSVPPRPRRRAAERGRGALLSLRRLPAGWARRPSALSTPGRPVGTSVPPL